MLPAKQFSPKRSLSPLTRLSLLLRCARFAVTKSIPTDQHARTQSHTQSFTLTLTPTFSNTPCCWHRRLSDSSSIRDCRLPTAIVIGIITSTSPSLPPFPSHHSLSSTTLPSHHGMSRLLAVGRPTRLQQSVCFFLTLLVLTIAPPLALPLTSMTGL